jgi:hypothetical protein
MALAMPEEYVTNNAKTSYLRYYASKYVTMKKPMRYNQRDKVPKRIKQYIPTNIYQAAAKQNINTTI